MKAAVRGALVVVVVAVADRLAGGRDIKGRAFGPGAPREQEFFMNPRGDS